jgi:tetratricopeptide (TPR) repeat protein
MRRAVAALVLVGALAGVPYDARAQEPTTEEALAAEAAEEQALREAYKNAADDATRVTAAKALATWLEERARFLDASGLRKIVRQAEPTAENAAAEARAVLGFAEQVLAGGGGGAGIRAAFEDARIALTRAREMGADDVETALGLARCAAAQENPEGEIRELTRAVERWPDDVRARRGLAFALLNGQRFEEAIPLFERLSADAPEESLLVRALAYCARGAGNEELAVSAAERAIALEPDRAESWQALWSVYAPQKRHGELAVAILAHAEKHPESAAATHYAGFALSSARRHDEALAWLEKAWTLEAGNHAARMEAARIRITAQNDEPGAAALCNDVLTAVPGHPEALDLLSFLAVKLGNEQRFEEAVPYFRAVAEARPDDGQAWANLGLTLRWAGHFEEADAAYLKAEENAPADAQIRNDHGLLLLVMRRDDDATRVFLAAHEVDALANDGLENLGFMARERGDLAEARKWFETAWKAAVRRGDQKVITRQRRNADDVRFPLPPVR